MYFQNLMSKPNGDYLYDKSRTISHLLFGDKEIILFFDVVKKTDTLNFLLLSLKKIFNPFKISQGFNFHAPFYIRFIISYHLDMKTL